jgi:hypothetical protein
MGSGLSKLHMTPFLPLVLAAEHSRRLSLGTSIAVAFSRSPAVLVTWAGIWLAFPMDVLSWDWVAR